MWYIKKTAESVWNASKNLIDKRSNVQKVIDSIAESQEEILSTNKLGELAQMSYQLEAFNQIVDTILERLKKFTYDVTESQKSLNLLICTNYLIKHGATATVDILRSYKHIFKKYEQLQLKTIYDDFVEQAKMDSNLEKIKSRAHHIYQLLEDKQKLLKQKQLSMLVKQKLKLYEKSKLKEMNNQKYNNANARQTKKGMTDSLQNQSNSTPSSKLAQLGSRAQQFFNNPQELSNKLQGLLENYVWKYVDKLDDTIQSASDKIMQQIDIYISGQPPNKFQMEEDSDEEDNGQKDNNEGNGNKGRQEDDDDLMKKIQEEVKDIKKVQNHQNLLDFEEVVDKNQQSENKNQQSENKKQAVDLI